MANFIDKIRQGLESLVKGKTVNISRQDLDKYRPQPQFKDVPIEETRKNYRNVINGMVPVGNAPVIDMNTPQPQEDTRGWNRENLPSTPAVTRPVVLGQDESRPRLRGFQPDMQVVKTLRNNIPLVNHIRKTFGDNDAIAMAVLLGENRNLNPKIQNMEGSSADNLWQILTGTWGDFGQGDKYDPYNNTDIAKKIYDKRGFNDWSSFTQSYNKTGKPLNTVNPGRPQYEQFLPYLDYLDQYQTDPNQVPPAYMLKNF